jgi:hypothetical protein
LDGSSVIGREVRTARNQVTFRAVNEKIVEVGPVDDLGTVGVVCECSRTSCAQLLQITLGAFEAVRRSPRRFVVIPEHVDHAVERLIVVAGDYAVVEVFSPAGIEGVHEGSLTNR